ncbi:hypothetical protein [Pseudomonas arsenicoxydans]|uniref:Sensor histidine kinase n=1 Tax=Pseudomonas arsenicoxydans TaxID=702115 RepID=A0A4P6G9S1_9PSED|nr:hypothetical protein [Pseudomonas arsenicoxydans]QAY86250.1 hypothetical protein CUN61_20855 [Pseudomonas arsenicoxydans]
MRFSDFIIKNLEPILQAWEDFARTIEVPGEALDSKALRDHAEQMLRAIALDMRTYPSAQAQITKAHGNAPADELETTASAALLSALSPAA